ncbi:MAG: GTP 3',8-cyclase MoaA [Bacillota bacterium]
MKELIDKFGRKINYLRISVTDRCNLRCIYCMPEDGIDDKGHSQILSYEDIIKIVRTGVELGIKKVRITGGEPLVRKGLDSLIYALSELGLEEITMTTNGVLLAKLGERLKKSGLDRVNISLDTLNKENYEKITRRDHFDDVKAGIEAALNLDLSPVKINVVVIKGFNDNEIDDFVELSRIKNLHIRFIEYMPLGLDISEEKFYSSEKIKEYISKKYNLYSAEIEGSGPAKYYKVEGAKGSIGFISAISNNFCANCNRLRLTADGKIKPCLGNNIEVKIADRMSEDDIVNAYKKAVELKPASHSLNFNQKSQFCRSMSQIGG